MIQESWEEHGLIAMATLIPPDEYSGEEPLVQAYGFCMAGDLVCVLQSPDTGDIMLPGGTVEDSESPEETLRREVMAEADLDVAVPELLGVQRVDYNATHPNYEAKRIYQARFAASVRDAGFLGDDPSEGFSFNRCFVPADEVAELLGWGNIADDLAQRAQEYKGSGAL